MHHRSIPSWLSGLLQSAPPLVALVALLFATGQLRVILLVLASVGIAVSLVFTLSGLFRPISVDRPTPSIDPESREPQAFLDAFDEVMSSARPARPARFSKGVVLDGERMSGVLYELRLFLVRALVDLKWYQWRREDEGKDPVGDWLERILDDLGGSIDRLEDLVDNGLPVPFRAGVVRLDAQRVSAAAEPLRRWLASYAKELAAYQSLYPGQRERAIQIQEEQRTIWTRRLTSSPTFSARPKVVPLRDQVSIVPSAVEAITHRMRLALARERRIAEPAELEREIDKLDALVREAKAGPFTDEVRIDRQALDDIVDDMLAKLGELIRED